MNATEIKTRQGLILQGLVREALKIANLTYKENWQYEANSEKPDFVIPDTNTPKYVVEVHQTDARSSFRMKILRGFTAVTEAKAFFGNQIISVNLLFGDPDTELPESNVLTLCGYFDVNLIPSKDSVYSRRLVVLENKSLELASDGEVTVANAVTKILKNERNSITHLSNYIVKSLGKAKPNSNLFQLWDEERKRIENLTYFQINNVPTFNKRAILQSLLLSDAHFHELFKVKDPNKCSLEIKEQLLKTKLATKNPSIKGDVLVLEQSLRQFLYQSDSLDLRELCEKRIEVEPKMYWFFEDIRDEERRLKMAELFVKSVAKKSLLNDLLHNLTNSKTQGIEHGRAWLIDICVLVAGISQHALTRTLFKDYPNPDNFGDAASHFTLKTDRFSSVSYENVVIYAKSIVDIFNKFTNDNSTSLKSLDKNKIADNLLAMRLGAVIKLQKLNPLYLVIESIAEKLGLIYENKSTNSFLSDLSGSSDPVGKFYLYHISNGNKKILVNAVSVHDNHGDDKSKEWGARRKATLYRLINNEIVNESDIEGIFVIDGEWKAKDITRLYKSGWNYIIKLSEFEELLKTIFKDAVN